MRRAIKFAAATDMLLQLLALQGTVIMRSSVYASVCSSMGTQQQTVGLLLRARPAGDIDRANAGVLRCQRTY